MTQAIATAQLFRTRDLFVHDGNHLRRLRLSAPVQMAMLAAMALLFAWSAYSAIRLFVAPAPVSMTAAPAAVSSDIARLAAATEARVRQIEQRQQILAAMIAGEKVDPEVIAKLGYTEPTSGADLAQGGPFDSATQADPTFKSLFTSWKKLDNLADGAIAVPSDKPVKTAEFTSGYGTRTDPFRGGAARHQGIDLAAPIGTRSTPPPRASSPRQAGIVAAMATSSSSTTAAASKPAMATCRGSWSAPASASLAARSSATWARPVAPPEATSTMKSGSTIARSTRSRS